MLSGKCSGTFPQNRCVRLCGRLCDMRVMMMMMMITHVVWTVTAPRVWKRYAMYMYRAIDNRF